LGWCEGAVGVASLCVGGPEDVSEVLRVRVVATMWNIRVVT
jgi:hypothetical protein